MGKCPICHGQYVDKLYQKNGKCSQCGESIIDYTPYSLIREA